MKTRQIRQLIISLNLVLSILAAVLIALFVTSLPFSTALAFQTPTPDLQPAPPPVAFDFSQYFDVSVAGIPLAFVVLLVVEILKMSGVSGKPLFFSSLGVGFAFGVAYQFSVLGIPADFAGYFAYAIYGLGLGGMASGAHNYMKKNAERAAQRATEKIAPDYDDEQPFG